jgi:hypothetical protein
MKVQQELFLEDDLLNLKRDINVNIAHAGLDIIRSRDPLYKQEMKRYEEQKQEQIRAKNNGSVGHGPAAKEEDPLVVLKKLFKPKEYGSKILDKNHIANKYRQKYLEDMKKEKKKMQAQLLKT